MPVIPLFSKRVPSILANLVRTWKTTLPALAIGGVFLAATLGPGGLQVRSRAAGISRDSGRSQASIQAATPTPDLSVTVLAAGDIASCDNEGDERSAAVLGANPGTPILTLGDQAYPDGTAANFAECFDPSWGQYKGRIRPVPGNHEYYSANAAPYFDYFGAAAGPSQNLASRGYYSFDLGTWHIVALNSELDISPAGTQMAWLRADLAANPSRCTLAFWHRPLFTAGSEYPTGFADVQPFWDVLDGAGAEIVLNGHDHSYQRYQPMNAAGESDALGIREFVVGTGGRDAHPLLPDARREAGYAEPGASGVLKLKLSPTGYEWTFLGGEGTTFTDSGSGQCH